MFMLYLQFLQSRLDHVYLQYVTNRLWMLQYGRDLVLSFYIKHIRASIFSLCMTLLQRKASVENWELNEAVYVLYMHVIPCGSWSRFFLGLREWDLKAMVWKCIQLSSYGKNHLLPRGDTLAIWIGFFIYANCKVCFPKDNICYSSKVYRMSVNRLESKQKEFGDHLGDGTCASFHWSCRLCTAPWFISQLQIRVCLCWILAIAFSSGNVPALGHSISGSVTKKIWHIGK